MEDLQRQSENKNDYLQQVSESFHLQLSLGRTAPTRIIQINNNTSLTLCCLLNFIFNLIKNN